MKVKIKDINSILLFQIFFLTFLGYYAILLLAINFGMSGFTRQITIPIRVYILGLLVGLIFFSFNRIKIYNHLKIFILFSMIFLVRVIADFYSGSEYYLSIIEVFFYFISFSFIPYFSISTFRFNERYIEVLFNSILLSGFFFSILSLIFYWEFIGQVGRLTANSVGEEVISPLSLSYSSTLLIGVVIFYFIYNKTNNLKKYIGFTTLLLSIVPFLLGASRGSLIALFVPFLFLLMSRITLKTLTQGIVFSVSFGFLLFYLSEIFESGLFQRFTYISSDVDQSSSSSIRLMMWKNSFLQFQYFPFFGDKLGVDGFNGYYPHNFLLEVLQSTGVVGFFPLIVLLFIGLKKSFFIFKFFPEYSWIVVIFIQSIVKHLFSGAIYSASWLWFSLALIFAIDRYIYQKDNDIFNRI